MKKKNILLMMLVFIVSACNSAEVFETTEIPMFIATLTEIPIATSTATNTPTVEPTVTDIPTATQVPTHNVSVEVWHDYNGSGTWDDGEPAVSGVAANLNYIDRANATSEILSSCTTGENGTCILEGVPTQGDREYRVYVDAPEIFNYIRLGPTQASYISIGVNSTITGEAQINVPLATNITTLPFESDVLWSIVTYQDYCGDWKVNEPDGQVCNYLGTTDFTSDGHTSGMDIGVPAGTPIYYPGVTGKVRGIVLHGGSDSIIQFFEIGAPGWDALYYDFGHLNLARDFKIGDTINRGDLIGYVWEGGGVYNLPGFHFSVCSDPLIGKPTDFYNVSPQLSLWTVANQPQPIEKSGN